jgi:hypothetical protein
LATTLCYHGSHFSKRSKLTFGLAFNDCSDTRWEDSFDGDIFEGFSCGRDSLPTFDGIFYGVFGVFSSFGFVDGGS